MKQYNYSDLNKSDIQKLVQRNVDPANEIRTIVEDVIKHVQQNGDAALLDYALKFDKVELEKLYLDKDELSDIAASVTDEQKAALQIAYNNIYRFHQSQLKTEDKVETMPGVTCWRELRPIEKVGLYIPGGSAVLPSTFLMLGIPAKIAGCHKIVVCSPPQKNGKVNAFIAYVALCLELTGSILQEVPRLLLQWLMEPKALLKLIRSSAQVISLLRSPKPSFSQPPQPPLICLQGLQRYW